MTRTTATLASLALLAAAMGISAASAQDRPVKIGILNDQASVYSAITGPGSVAAARLAIEDMGGTLLGKPIELVSADHGHKPDVGSVIARRWFDTEGVDAIFDIYSSGVALAVQGIAEQKNKLLIVSMASSRDISGKSCSPNGMQWANDGYEVANLTIKGASDGKPTSWFFLTVDYTAGHSIERDSQKLIEKDGGKFVGSVRFPLNTPDFSSFLLQAQNSGAKNIGFIGGGADMTNAIKQAAEFGIDRTGQRFVPFSLTTVDIDALGNDATQGMPLVLSYYWDASDQTKAFAERFKKAFGKMPSDPQANVYSAVLHYLKSVKAAGTSDTTAVLAKMKETPVEDLFTSGARIREDGRLMRDVYYAEAKKPGAKSGPTDLITLVKKVPGTEAFIPASESECKALKK
ncbi:ABC transporter substrate-binding protein [Bradyrhizobium liaoningense]|uniref:ABC transporter substrate-binding protein n=1 Tax=Bradyrhizobium liaoningense TaxID=43992 RepID=UPI001BAE5095|nr:ABC transporter substrate-binding protein [Bradyrhizobium liaoningense]MBR0820202.1 ABC transporter substrate-binding protein [Bradyrhizobium liaoningense]